ncbi:MAG: metallophosphoesterase family protein [Nitrospinales bacterium]
MKIGVISDTHGLVRPEVYDVFEGVDLILHAGDIGSRDVIIELEAIATVKAVAGNVDVDLFHLFEEKMKIPIGKHVFHLQHIVEEIPEETDSNRESVSELIVFGHSHQPLSRQVGKTLYFNPGSAGPRRFNLPVAVGIISIDDETVRDEVIRLIPDN